MPPRRRRPVLRKQPIYGKESGRGLKIISRVYVPEPDALSETSDHSDFDCENEFLDEPILPPSNESSPAPSISNSLLNLNIDSADEDTSNPQNDRNSESYDESDKCELVDESEENTPAYSSPVISAASPSAISPQSPSLIQATISSPLIPAAPSIPNDQNILSSSSSQSILEPILDNKSVTTTQSLATNNPLKADVQISLQNDKDNTLLDNIIRDVCPPSPMIPNYDMIPSISSLPSLPSVSPATSPSGTRKRKRFLHQTHILSRLVSPKKLRSHRKTATHTNSSSAAILSTPSNDAQRTSKSSSLVPTPATSSTRKTKSTTPVIAVPAKKKKATKKYRLNFKWKKAVFRHRAELECNDENYVDLPYCDSPLDYFYKFFSPDIISDIVRQTNMYSVQSTGKSIQLTEEELRDFIAMHIIMGVVDMPSYLDYWSQKYRYPLVADVMPLKRYQTIRRFLHFADNNLVDSDRYFKIRPVLEKVRQNCLAQEHEHKFSVDEMMIPYKGTKAGKRRQYMKDKPTKWGFKVYVRAGISGMIYDFIFYGGNDTFRFHKFTAEEEAIGFGGQVVIALCKSIKNKPAIVYCDNFFSSPEMFVLLRENYGVFGLGTIRGNRLRGAENQLPSDKIVKKQPRGSYSQVVCDQNKVNIVKWNDNKVVTLISTFVAAEPVEKIKRYCKVVKRKVDVDCPQVVREYNKHMGGVDLADMLIALYRTPFKSRRWYLGIFVQLIDICINNAWLLNRSNKSSKMSLKEFRYELYDNLLKLGRSDDRSKEQETKVKNPTKPRPPSPIRFDDVGHFPSVGPNGRCRHCKLKTTVICIKCNIRLCFVTGHSPRNCFLDFHTK